MPTFFCGHSGVKATIIYQIISNGMVAFFSLIFFITKTGSGCLRCEIIFDEQVNGGSQKLDQAAKKQFYNE